MDRDQWGVSSTLLLVRTLGAESELEDIRVETKGTLRTIDWA